MIKDVLIISYFSSIIMKIDFIKDGYGVNHFFTYELNFLFKKLVGYIFKIFQNTEIVYTIFNYLIGRIKI